MVLAACAGPPLKSERPSAPALPASGAANSWNGARPPAPREAPWRIWPKPCWGQPYRFGGAAPGGFDCSGLVAYAAAGNRHSRARTAQEQFAVGTPVSRGELRPGDLVFMHLAHKELHVGIAIGGERFVHAPSSGGRVRIDSLEAPPYAGGYLGARRLNAR